MSAWKLAVEGRRSVTRFAHSHQPRANQTTGAPSKNVALSRVIGCFSHRSRQRCSEAASGAVQETAEALHKILFRV